MEFCLQNNGDIKNITAELSENGTLVVTVGNVRITAAISRISENHLYLELGEGRKKKGVNLYTADDSAGKWIMTDGAPCVIENPNAPSLKKTKKKKGAALPGVITPPMPAIVVSVPVTQGERVEKGQKLVVLTAMKMETTLSAPFNGIVTAVNVKEGDKVSPGDILVDLAPGEKIA